MKSILAWITTYYGIHKTLAIYRKIYKDIRKLMPKCHTLQKRLQQAAASETGVEEYGARYLAELEVCLKHLQDAYILLDRNRPLAGIYDAAERLEYYSRKEQGKKH